MKQLTDEEILLIKNDLVSSKSPKRRSAAKKIAKYKIFSLANELLKAYLEERKDIRTWETQSEMINALAKINCKAAIPYLREIVDENKDMDTVTMKASLSYIRLNRETLNDMTLILSLLEIGKRSVFMGAVYAMAYDDVIPTEQEIITVLDIFEKRNVYDDPYTYDAQPIISSMYKWRNEIIAPFLEHYKQYPQYAHFIENTFAGKKSCIE